MTGACENIRQIGNNSSNIIQLSHIIHLGVKGWHIYSSLCVHKDDLNEHKNGCVHREPTQRWLCSSMPNHGEFVHIHATLTEQGTLPVSKRTLILFTWINTNAHGQPS